MTAAADRRWLARVIRGQIAAVANLAAQTGEVQADMVGIATANVLAAVADTDATGRATGQAADQLAAAADHREQLDAALASLPTTDPRKLTERPSP